MKGFALHTYILSPHRLVTVLHILQTEAAVLLIFGKMANSFIDATKDAQ